MRIHSLLFVAARFIIARSWKEPRCSSAEEWIQTMWYIYTMEYYSAIKTMNSWNFFSTIKRTTAWYLQRNGLNLKIITEDQRGHNIYPKTCRKLDQDYPGMQELQQNRGSCFLSSFWVCILSRPWAQTPLPVPQYTEIGSISGNITRQESKDPRIPGSQGHRILFTPVRISGPQTAWLLAAWTHSGYHDYRIQESNYHRDSSTLRSSVSTRITGRTDSH